MKVIIAGSRHMGQEHAHLIQQAVTASGFDVTEVVCGMALGADALGKAWAETHNIPVKAFPANWNLYGKAAGPIRNKQMADYADAAIIFIWQRSKGSENMLKHMEKVHKRHFVVRDGVIHQLRRV